MKNARKAKKHLTKAQKLLKELRESIAKHPSPIFKMSEEGVIKQMRKTREKLWEKKLAARH